MIYQMLMWIEIRDLQTTLYIATLLYILGMTLIILLDNKPAQSTLAWLLTVYFLPFIGLFIYLFAGIDWKKSKILHQRPEERFRDQLKDVLDKQKSFKHELKSLTEQDITQAIYQHDIRKSVQLLLNSNHSLLTLHNQVELFHHGKPFFEQVKTDLKAATSSIHMEFFIWKSDKLGQAMRDILVERARAGVEVRLIFDGVGCFWTMSRAYKRSLRKAGVDFQIFLDPLKFFTSGFANYLNHRKLIIIDGQISYIGGMNMAQEYISGGANFKHTRDTGLRLRGEISQQLQTVFATDWYNSCRRWLTDEKYFPEPILLEPQPRLPVQLACSGPDSDWYSIRQLIFSLIMNAKREVYIQSPYFIPDESIKAALITTALSGIQIHIMMSGPPNKASLWNLGSYTERIPGWAAETYFEPLLQAGCRIYRYDRGFLHCKTLSVDEVMATIGTCNLDVRSFELDYEINAMLYDQELAREVKQQFLIDKEYCREITLNSLNTTSWLYRLRNSILRVFSPLL